MAYSPTSWKRGDIITAEKLNKVETGLQAVASVDIQSAQATTLAADVYLCLHGAQRRNGCSGCRGCDWG